MIQIGVSFQYAHQIVLLWCFMLARATSRPALHIYYLSVEVWNINSLYFNITDFSDYEAVIQVDMCASFFCDTRAAFKPHMIWKMAFEELKSYPRSSRQSWWQSQGHQMAFQINYILPLSEETVFCDVIVCLLLLILPGKHKDNFFSWVVQQWGAL